MVTTRSWRNREEAALLRQAALSALRLGKIEAARNLVRESDLLDPPPDIDDQARDMV